MTPADARARVVRRAAQPSAPRLRVIDEVALRVDVDDLPANLGDHAAAYFLLKTSHARTQTRTAAAAAAATATATAAATATATATATQPTASADEAPGCSAAHRLSAVDAGDNAVVASEPLRATMRT
jgi:hypothetical protein